jgi:hypothetical protein
MEHEFIQPEVITIRPATIFAFIKIFPLVIAAIAFLFLAALYFPGLVWVSIALMCFAWYRCLFIRRSVYEITPKLSASAAVSFFAVPTRSSFGASRIILLHSLFGYRSLA